MPFETSASWYMASLEDCERRKEKIPAFLKHFQTKKEELRLKDMETYISVGAGDGVLDSDLILSVMPNCRLYYGIEANPVYLRVLETNMQQKCPHVQLQSVPCFAEEWCGLSQPADVIVMSSVLYYFEEGDKCFQFLKKCRTWLKPGGKMIILMSYGDTSFLRAAERFQTDYGKLYNYVQVLEDLKRLGVKYTTDDVYVEFDLSQPTQELANFFWQRQANAKETSDIFTFLRKSYPSGKESMRYGVCVVTNMDGM